MAKKISRSKANPKTTNTRTKKALGLGVGALLSGIHSEMEANEEALKTLVNTIAMLPLEQISRNIEQPRSKFDAESLEELAASIKTYGLIQPITVQQKSEREYLIISGERRFRASKLAGLTEIPAYIRVANDQEILEMALVENIQREDLNPLEIALTYNRLITECNLTHEVMAKRVGKGRGTITNYLSVLRLPEIIINALRDKEISLGHGKVLAGISDEAIQEIIFQQIVLNNLSVRATEVLAKKFREANITLGHWDVLKGTEDATLQHFLLEEIKALQLDVLATKKLAAKLNNPDFTTEHWNALTELREHVKDTNKLSQIQDKIYHLIIDKGLSVSATKEWIKNYLNPQAEDENPKKTAKLPYEYERVQEKIVSFFETKGVQIKLNAKNKNQGQIVIPFDKNNDNLNRLLELLN